MSPGTCSTTSERSTIWLEHGEFRSRAYLDEPDLSDGDAIRDSFRKRFLSQ